MSASTWYAHSPVTRSNDVTVLLGTTTLGSGAVSSTSFAGRGNALNFSFSNLAVTAGSVLSFFSTPSGQQFGSIAGLRETVDFTPSVMTAPVPEPTTRAMVGMGMGMALLAGVSKRKRA